MRVTNTFSLSLSTVASTEQTLYIGIFLKSVPRHPVVGDTEKRGLCWGKKVVTGSPWDSTRLISLAL